MLPDDGWWFTALALLGCATLGVWVIGGLWVLWTLARRK